MLSLKKRLQTPDPEYRCDVRWWLAEGFHTDQTLKKEIKTLAEYGFGAAEFLAINELGIDSACYGWGSEEWVHDTQIIIEETTKNGLGASMTCGTNWSNANLPDYVHKPDDQSASKELNFTLETLAAGQKRYGMLQKVEKTKDHVYQQELIAVIAVKKVGEKNGRAILNGNSIILTDLVLEGCLAWEAPTDGEYLLFTFWLHGTGQIATPSVSISYTVNYMDRYGIDKLIEYWNKEVITPHLQEYINKNNRIQMYMDSLELSTYGQGGLLWGYTLIDEFKSRRGYDIIPYLPFVLRRIEGLAFGPHDYYYDMADQVLTTKIRNDLYQTFTDLYIENMLKPMQDWLHSIGMTLRAEVSYGLPFEISQPGKYVDGVETESLEFSSQLDSYRGLAGVAHLYNKVFSSETGATKMNYMMGLDFYTQIIYTQFAAGITKTVLHGYSSICGSDQSTDWPGHEGMWPIFSERFGERQPCCRFYKDWTSMIARFQYLLRNGKPRRDVAVLRLDYNFWNEISMVNDELETYETKFLRSNEGIYWRDTAMQNAGYTYDYFAPQFLEDEEVLFSNGEIQPEGPGYKALIIYQAALPYASAKKILQYARQGLPVIFANGLTEIVQTDTTVHHIQSATQTPYNDGLDDKLMDVISKIKALPNVIEIDNPADVVQALKTLDVHPRAGFLYPNKNILTLLREDGVFRYLYIYNYMYTEKESCSATIKLEGEGTPYAVDCWTGDLTPLGIYRFESGYTHMNVTLQPGEATMFVVNITEKADLYSVSANASVVNQDSKMSIVAFESGIYSVTLSNGEQVEKEIICRSSMNLPRWDITVESWNKGEKKIINEDRGFGYITQEVYYETSKTIIEVGETELIPWKDISTVGPEVSGVGFYKTSFILPPDWNNDDGAVLSLGSTNGNAAAIFVNGHQAPAYNFNKRTVDITSLVKQGENEIKVEVGSTLANRLIANGYYIESGELSVLLLKTAFGHDDEENDAMLGKKLDPETQNYGLTGETKIILYKKVSI